MAISPALNPSPLRTWEKHIEYIRKEGRLPSVKDKRSNSWMWFIEERK